MCDLCGRVPCDYKNKNLAVRVEESSKNPNYLAIKFLYQGGQTEIVAVDVATVIITIKYWVRIPDKRLM